MNIGLIAMSGIRVCDEELLGLGLTLPGFVERSKVIASLPSLGLLTLAGMTPKQHRVEYLEIADLKQTLQSNNMPTGFDLVAISSYGPQIDEAYQLADFLRKQGTTVVIGGLHATTVPDEVEQRCDAIVIGEGEPVWEQLLADVESDKLRRRYRSDGKYCLDESPMPAFELLDIDKYNRLTVQTSRGCPHRCEFCASSVLLSRRYKQKPVDRVLAEIDRIIEVWENPFIEFADDNGMVNRAYWRELLPRLKSRKVSWFTETDVSVAEDPDLLRMMREAGCVQVLVGLESPTPEPLRGLDGNRDWKLRQWSKYTDAIQKIQSQSISVNGCFMVGLDGHDVSIFDQIPKFVESSGLHEVQVTIPTPFPGTPYYARLQREGRLTHEEDWRRLTLFDLNYVPARMTESELTDGFKTLVTHLYSDECVAARRAAFKRCMRAGYRRRKKTSVQ